MKQTVTLPDGLASDVTGFAATHDVPEHRAYELLVSVGLATLEGREFDVVIDDGRLILECPACEHAFETPDEFADHDHGD